MRKRAFIVICAHGSTIPTAQRVSHSPIQSVDFGGRNVDRECFTRGSERRRELFAIVVCTILDTVRTISMQGLSAWPRGTRQRLTAAHDSTTAAGRRHSSGSRQHRNPTTDDGDVDSESDQHNSMRWPRAQITHGRHRDRASVHCHILASVGGRGSPGARSTP